jgi:hypothetical protein
MRCSACHLGIVGSLLVALGGCGQATATQVPVPSGRPSASGSGNTARTLGIPPGHLPPPGLCRIWLPGDPPGHQPAPASCDRLAGHVPPGAWLVYRPAVAGRGRGHGKKDKRVVRVTVYGESGPSLIRIFDLATGSLLDEERP